MVKKNGAKKNQGKANWTVTVYMSADNSLAEESVWAITEILKTESQIRGSVRIEVLFDSNAVGMPTKVFSIPTTNGTGQISANMVKRLGRLRTLGEDFATSNGSHALPSDAKHIGSRPSPNGDKLENAADSRVLKRFLTDTLTVRKNNPQLLILSGHGSGAIGDFLSGKRAQEAISVRSLGGTLKEVIESLKDQNHEFKYDIIGMDSCLMSMAEVAYELRDSANILIGSEGFEPETGWPYKEIIPKIKPSVKPTNLARIIVDEYIKYYAEYVVAGTSVDLSALNLGMADALKESLFDLSEALLKEFGAKDQSVIDAVLLAHWRAQSYKNEQYVDLWDFCDLLEKGCEVGAIKHACQRVRGVIDGSGDKNGKDSNNSPFVITSKHFGVAFQHSHGVSVYFPWKESPALDEYQKLTFARDTKWGKFLKTYVKVTQRESRGQLGPKVEEINITAAERPLIIPVQEDATIGIRSAPDTFRAMLSGREGMKNPPDSFLINTVTGEAL